MAGGAFPIKLVRSVFYNRECGSCFKCGRTVVWQDRGFGWSMHHRKPRGAGGTRRIMTAADGLVLCGSGTTGCHGWVESHRDIATEHGYLISRNASTPEFEPDRVRVRRDDGRWFLLTADGRAVEVEKGNTR